MPIDLAYLQQWVGKRETVSDTLALTPMNALAAALDHDRQPFAPGDALPPLWHWLYFLPVHRQSLVGPDGHPKRGGFLPPVQLPRRMWAGSQLLFSRRLRAGDKITRFSTIEDVTYKNGRSGDLVFVKVLHEVHDAAGLAMTERQDIVYRDHPAASEVPPILRAAPESAQWKREIHPDPVLLFRYSALTLNGHRIHYDRPYAVEQEGYPGLVVHGPLLATLLLDLLHRELPEETVKAYSFRARSPVIDTAAFFVCGQTDGDQGKTVRLWIAGNDGTLRMEADAVLA
ncbi:MaoC family dehydratase N-terminal domain-containing protein [Paraburkholderia sp. BL25I1N1]|uniref:FAS1-like dehydratase domain-containing protein n=1 Tax=Paraburkholderia sp. BL25I1N1 TaxID=1938804 RepID=UPI000D05E607|nr:MaoC family dehydratase N-terminal domain-containing protein [Paraburkholderia sp. BL25I1N1]PRX96890.1 3-methylfumaryl-CoA hydratase [Paraburkholderia sp. BL25I1N1]